MNRADKKTRETVSNSGLSGSASSDDPDLIIELAEVSEEQRAKAAAEGKRGNGHAGAGNHDAEAAAAEEENGGDLPVKHEAESGVDDGEIQLRLPKKMRESGAVR